MKKAKGEQTKRLICETALDLFNEKGAAFVNTHHIARSMSISPGNLYYHFRSREEIVSALFDQFVSESVVFWSNRIHFENKSPVEAFIPWFRLVWKYRFFYIERTVLVGRDPGLAERWIRTLGEFRSKILGPHARNLEAQKILTGLGDDAHLERILTNSQIINNSFFVNTDNPLLVDEATVEWGFRQLAQYWLSFHSEKWKPAVERYLTAPVSERFIFPRTRVGTYK